MKTNPNIILNQADKTKAKVLLDKQNYVDKMLVNLIHKTAYKCVEDHSDTLKKKKQYLIL